MKLPGVGLFPTAYSPPFSVSYAIQICHPAYCSNIVLSNRAYRLSHFSQITVSTSSANGISSNGQSSKPASPWPLQDTLFQRQRMALPPTPDSPEYVRAPMATGDEVTSDME